MRERLPELEPELINFVLDRLGGCQTLEVLGRAAHETHLVCVKFPEILRVRESKRIRKGEGVGGGARVYVR